jgi:hypothetical protein
MSVIQKGGGLVPSSRRKGPLSPNLQVLCMGRSSTLNLHTNVVLDENKKPIAVQIPIDDFQRLEELIEN